MISGISASLSGIANALRRLDITANNIANQQTHGYQALRAQNVEAPEGGVAIGAITRNPSPSPPRLDSTGPLDSEGSNVDPAVEQVNLLLNRRQFEASLTALKAQDDLLGSLLNIIDKRS